MRIPYFGLTLEINVTGYPKSAPSTSDHDHPGFSDLGQDLEFEIVALYDDEGKPFKSEFLEEHFQDDDGLVEHICDRIKEGL